MTKAKTKLTTADFPGVVVLKEWYQTTDGRAVRCIAGKVSILQASDIMGFDPGKGEANWVARVAGPKGSVTIAGCQVRAVQEPIPTGTLHETLMVP